MEQVTPRVETKNLKAILPTLNGLNNLRTNISMQEHYQDKQTNNHTAALLQVIEKNKLKEAGLLPDNLNPFSKKESGVGSIANYDRLYSSMIVEEKRNEPIDEDPMVVDGY